MRRELVGLILVIAANAVELRAQTPAASLPRIDEAGSERPGLVRLGALYLTPYLHIGTLGIDTNVFYTATARQADFTASGGPGLEIVRPFGSESRLRVDGGLDYLYFAKTDSQRRLNGYGSADLDLRGVKTRFVIEEKYERKFFRPSYEINERIQQEAEGTRAMLRRDLADHWRLLFFGSRLLTRTDHQLYLGTDLGDTLSDDRYQAGSELQLGLSIKTRLVAGGEEDWYRYPFLPDRDGRSALAYGGFRTDRSALVAGSALVGMRWFKLDSGAARNIVYADVDATWTISFKSKLGGSYRRDIDYSAFATSGTTPTNLTEFAEIFLEKFLTRTVYLRPFARQYRLVSDGDVTLAVPGEGIVTNVLKDRAREAGGELGYQFRARVRAGVRVSYTDRTSSIQTFGIDGLLAGFTLQYNPPQPTFR